MYIFLSVPSTSKQKEISSLTLFLTEFPDFFEYCNLHRGKLLILGDFNMHFDCPTNPNTARILDIFQTFKLEQAVSQPNHRRGHILDWVLYREEERLLLSCLVKHGVSSDYLPVLCYFDVSRPKQQSVFHPTKNVRAIDRQAFKADVSTLITTLDKPTADQLNDQLRALLDRHAPATQRKVSQRRSSPWYNTVASQLRALKQEKRRAERQWLRSGMTVHRQIFNALKHKITRLVNRAKTTFYSSKITVSTLCKKLFYVTNRLMNKTKCTQIPSSVPIARLPQRFSDFCQKISTIRQNIDSLNIDRTLTLLPLVLLISFFSGKPLTHFSAVSETAFSALLKKIACKNVTLTRFLHLFCSIVLMRLFQRLPML